MMNETFEREAFEKYMAGSNLSRAQFEDYENNYVHGKWESWQARAALESAPASCLYQIQEPAPVHAVRQDSYVCRSRNRDGTWTPWMNLGGGLNFENVEVKRAEEVPAVQPGPDLNIDSDMDSDAPYKAYSIGLFESTVRALLATGGQAQAVKPRLDLTVNQMRQAIEFATGGFTPDTEGELETSLTFCIGPLKDDDGKVVVEGMHCWLTDLAEEGAIPLDEYPTESDLKKAQAPQAQADARDALTPAARDVLAERARQISTEGWTPEHDDEHDEGDMCFAAAGYAAAASDNLQAISKRLDYSLTINDLVHGSNQYPWPAAWEFKPCTPRRALVKSGALILAEIERIDRAAIAAAKEQK